MIEVSTWIILVRDLNFKLFEFYTYQNFFKEGKLVLFKPDILNIFNLYNYNF